MLELTKWKDQEINKLRRDMDRLFNRMWRDFGLSPVHREFVGEPSIDISETEDALHVTADVPGMEPEDLDILVSHDTLIIRGVKKSEIVRDQGRYHRIERRLGSFSRTVRLPCPVKVEEIKATYKDGILNVTMPKSGTGEARGVKVERK